MEDDNVLSEMDIFTLEMLSKPNKIKKLASQTRPGKENPLFHKHKKQIMQSFHSLMENYSNVCYGLDENCPLEIQELFIAMVDKVIRYNEMVEEREKFNNDSDEPDDPDIFTHMDDARENGPVDSSSYWGKKISKSRETLQKKTGKMEPMTLKSWAVPIKRNDPMHLGDF